MRIRGCARGRPWFLIPAITALLVEACGEGGGHAKQSVRGHAQEITVDSAALVQEFGLSPDRAHLLSSVTARYINAIGGPNAYVSALKKIGAQPSPASIQLYAGLLLLRGAARLGTPAIDSLSALRSRWFAMYYPSKCDLLVGPKDLKASWRALASIDSTDLVALFQLTTRATLAEIHETPSEPAFDHPRLIAAWRAFYSKLPITEQNRFVQFLDAPNHSTNDECWFQYQLWRVLPLVPEADSRILLWQIATNKFPAGR